MPPMLSVVLPVYNGIPYLREAVDSVLGQTFRNFELIIIDDGSTDDSAMIIETYADRRIRFFRQPNAGLARTLNRAISLAHGRFIVRHDQDDICFPQRFERQFDFMERHPDVAMVGAAAEVWVGSERTNRALAHPVDDAAIKFGMLFGNYFVHSSIMIRRAVFDVVGGYSEDKSRQPPEDYELWSRVIRKFKVANLPDVLIGYREVPTSMSRAGVNPFLPNLLKISAENIAWASGYPQQTPEVIALSRLSQGLCEGIPSGIAFSRLTAVVEAASRTIASNTGTPERQLGHAKRARLRRLRLQYWNCRTGGLLGKLSRGKLGCALKKLARGTGSTCR